MSCENPYFAESINSVGPVSFNDIYPIIKEYFNKKDQEVVVTNQIPGKNRQDDPWLTDWGEHWRITKVEEETISLKPRSLTGASEDKTLENEFSLRRDVRLFTGITIYSLHTYDSGVLSKVDKVYWSR